MKLLSVVCYTTFFPAVSLCQGRKNDRKKKLILYFTKLRKIPVIEQMHLNESCCYFSLHTLPFSIQKILHSPPHLKHPAKCGILSIQFGCLEFNHLLIVKKVKRFIRIKVSVGTFLPALQFSCRDLCSLSFLQHRVSQKVTSQQGQSRLHYQKEYNCTLYKVQFQDWILSQCKSAQL